MSDEYKRSVSKRLAKQYAVEALEKEREIRGYDSQSKKFTKSVDELSRYERGRLASVFSTARDYFDKAGEIKYSSKFDIIVQTYNQPQKEILGKSKKENPKPSREKLSDQDLKDLEAIKHWQNPEEKRRLTEYIHARHRKSLENIANNPHLKDVYGVMAIATLLASLFFVSSDFTGFVISNPITNDMQWIGLCFFICGLVFSLLAVKAKYFSKHL
jgi:hypothetical protein